jgi:hypothetical protein
MDSLTALDLSGFYLSPMHGVGQQMRVETIRNRLASIPLKDTLSLLAQLIQYADKDRRVLRDPKLIKDILPEPFATKAIDALRANKYAVLYTSQVVTALALNTLIYSSPEPIEISDEDLNHEIGMLILALAGVIESYHVSPDEMPLEIMRTDLWARLSDFDNWAEVLHRIVTEIYPTLKSVKGWIDIDKLTMKTVGMTTDLFRALTAASAIVANAGSASDLAYMFPRNFSNAIVKKDSLDKWINFYSNSLETAKKLAEQDVQDVRCWTFTTLYDRPLVQVYPSNHYLMRPWFLMNKATPLGFFSDIERMLRESNQNTGRWSEIFGRAVEGFGRKVIEENINSNARLLIDEVAICKAWGKGSVGTSKTCDVVIIDNDWLAIDFVFHRVKKETATNGDLNDLADDLAKTVVNKLQQIDQTLQRGLIKETPKDDIYSIIVVGAPFSSNGLIMNLIDKMVDDSEAKIIGKDKRCRMPMVLDLEEFWLLMEISKAESKSPAQVLKMWIESSLKTTSFRNWAITNRIGQSKLSRNNKRRGYAAHSMQMIFGRIV